MQDWKSYWFLLSGAQGLLLTIGLAARAKASNRMLLYLAILLGVLSLELLTNFAVSIHYTNRPGAIPFWILGSYLLIPPCLLNLARNSLNRPLLKKKNTWLLFIPAIVEIAVEAMIVILRKTGFSIPNLQSVTAWFVFTEIIPVAATITIIGWWAFQLKWSLFDRQKTNASADPRKHTRFLSYALLAYYFSLSILWLAEAVFGLRFSDLLEQLLAGSMLLLGYIVFLRTGIFDRLSFIPSSPVPPSQWQYDDDQAMQQLLALMETEKLFVQSRLSIDDLSASLQLPKRYLSQLISTRLNTTFISFINSYRVDEVIRKMQDPEQQNKTILALAMEAGFNSKSTFNQVFKAKTGMTPSEYLKNTC